MVRQNLLKEGASLSNKATLGDSSLSPVQNDTVSATLSTVVAKETWSNPPQEVRSNPSQTAEVGVTNNMMYSQDVNSTASPSEEYQILGSFQAMVLNWPTVWDSSQVEPRCRQQKECGNAKALSCPCAKCSRRLYTKASLDFFCG